VAPKRWPHRAHNLEGLWLAIEDIRACIDEMQIADEVAQRVRAEIESHRMIGFTLAQKVAGAALVLNILHLSGTH
jgi:hypothetical protein